MGGQLEGADHVEYSDQVEAADQVEGAEQVETEAVDQDEAVNQAEAAKQAEAVAQREAVAQSEDAKQGDAPKQAEVSKQAEGTALAEPAKRAEHCDPGEVVDQMKSSLVEGAEKVVESGQHKEGEAAEHIDEVVTRAHAQAKQPRSTSKPISGLPSCPAPVRAPTPAGVEERTDRMDDNGAQCDHMEEVDADPVDEPINARQLTANGRESACCIPLHQVESRSGHCGGTGTNSRGPHDMTRIS